MPPDQPMQRATDEEIINGLSSVLGYRGGWRVGAAGSLTARIAAEHLLRQLRQCGFVVMKGPGVGPPNTPEYGKAWRSRSRSRTCSAVTRAVSI